MTETPGTIGFLKGLLYVAYAYAYYHDGRIIAELDLSTYSFLPSDPPRIERGKERLGFSIRNGLVSRASDPFPKTLPETLRFGKSQLERMDVMVELNRA